MLKPYPLLTATLQKRILSVLEHSPRRERHFDALLGLLELRQPQPVRRACEQLVQARLVVRRWSNIYRLPTPHTQAGLAYRVRLLLLGVREEGLHYSEIARRLHHPAPIKVARCCARQATQGPLVWVSHGTYRLREDAS